MDPRAALARESHQLSLASAREAAGYRQRRDEIVRRLREEDPKYWTLGQLGLAVGCSRELIAHIVRQGDVSERAEDG